MPLDMSYVRQAADAIQKEQQENSDRRNISNYVFKVGQNRGRLLPPYPGSGELAMHVWHHFGLPAPFKHAFCWENMFPGRGIQCPVCTVLRNLKARGIDCWRQGAVDIPRTNWVDRMPLNPTTNMPLDLDKHPGVQLIDLKIHIFNYFIGIAAQFGVDLTSIDNGYDVVINFADDKQKDPAVMPGNPQPLCPQNPELGARWVSQMFDLRKIVKMPDWSTPDGRKAWEKLVQSANELERSYLQTSATAPGFPQQQANQPFFSQPTGPTAPPPQFQQPQAPFAPAPQYSQPASQTPPPPPPGPPAMPPPPPQYAQQAPAPSPPPPAMPPPPAFSNPQAMGDPNAVPFGNPASFGFPPPQPPVQPPQPPPQPPVQPPQPPPQPPVQPPPPNPPVQTTPPWEHPAPTAPTSAAPTMTTTTADGKPPCFAQSRRNLTVSFGANGNSPVVGGWSDDQSEVGYRCMMCPHELECGDKARTTYPQDYQKDASGAYPPR